MKSCLLIFALLSPSILHAELSTQEGIHHLYESPRPLGMGDAFIATVDDYNAVMYNPAGLARMESGQIDLSMDFALSSTFQSFANDIQNAGGGGASQQTQISNYTSVLQKYAGQEFGIRAGLFEGTVVRPNWGLAVIPADVTVDIVVNKTVGPSMDLKTYLDSTVAYGYGQDIKGVDGRLSWGVTGKFVNRGFASKSILPLDLVANNNLINSSTLQEGYTVDADLGVLYSPFLPSEGPLYGLHYAKPTFGAVVRNVGDIGFAHSLHLINKGQSAPPEHLYRVLDVGTKFELPTLGIFGGRAEADIRDIGHPYFSWIRGIHLGAEMNWYMTSWWKGSYALGINQGYPTFGFTALFSYFKLDLVTYDEDIGSFDQPKQNRMYMVKFNIDI